MKAFFTIGDAIEQVSAFRPKADGLAQKSRELILQLLDQTESPFSRGQYKPGHVTCTALVFHPTQQKVLFMHHHRLKRWLLPGGHVESSDESLAAAAAREASEETSVLLMNDTAPFLAGLDVHGIPGRKKEPYHLHHDLIWCFRASSEAFKISKEAPDVTWAAEADWDEMAVAVSIRRSIRRAAQGALR